MKQLTIMLLILLSIGITNRSNATSMPQTTNEHLTFKGVPIDGSLREYISKMKYAGFSYITTQDGVAILKGDFAGHKGCYIGVSTLKDTDLVCTIGVIFPEKKEWSSLENNYLNLKEMLTEKYGNPTECVEEFQGAVAPINNRDKLHRLNMDDCIYYTKFETPKGDITLSLDHKDMSSFFVKLQYWDKLNRETVKAKVMDDL